MTSNVEAIAMTIISFLFSISFNKIADTAGHVGPVILYVLILIYWINKSYYEQVKKHHNGSYLKWFRSTVKIFWPWKKQS